MGMFELLGEGAADEIEAIGSPGFRLLFGPRVGNDEEALKFDDGFLEAFVAKLRLHFAGVAEFEGWKRAEVGKGEPEVEGVAGDAA